MMGPDVESYLDFIVANTAAAMMVFNPGFRVAAANTAAAELLGVGRPDALRGMTVAELIAARPRRLPATRGGDRRAAATARMTERLRRVIADGERITNEELQLGTGEDSGLPRRLSTCWYPLRMADGGLVGAAVTATDVTRRRAAEDRLRRSEARYRSLVETAGLQVWSADRHGRVTSDTSWANLSGEAVERLRHGGWLDLIHPADQERVRLAWAEAVREGGFFEQEFRTGLRSRGYRNVIRRGVPMRDRGELIEFVGTTQDVTALRASERIRAEAFVRARAVSLTLQRAMLPAALPDSDELAMCARYVAGESGVEVGGDWYDVIPLAAGRVALVVGDVMGQGVEAATIMGHVRAAFRAYAALDLPPDQLMGHASALVGGLEAEPLVTAVYVIFDPWDMELHWVAAGHPSPLMRSPDGTVTRFTDEPDPPLGVQGGAYRRHTVAFPSGSVLALFSDGLVESRGRTGDAGIKELGAWLAAQATTSLDELADGMIDTLTGEVHSDDVALLLTASTPGGHPRVASLSAPESVSHLHDMRARVREVLGSFDVVGEDVENVLLLVNELVTNAMLHSHPRRHDPAIMLRLRRSSRHLHLEVFDPSHRPPVTRLPDQESERGRGLLLVGALAERWGTRIRSNGKYVWCTLRLAEGA